MIIIFYCVLNPGIISWLIKNWISIDCAALNQSKPEIKNCTIMTYHIIGVNVDQGLTLTRNWVEYKVNEWHVKFSINIGNH